MAFVDGEPMKKFILELVRKIANANPLLKRQID
jgi:hypothetical protein